MLPRTDQTMAECVATFGADAVEPYRSAKAAAYDAVAGQDCLQEHRRIQGGCAEHPDATLYVSMICDRVFSGERGLGESCESDLECAPVGDGVALCKKPLGSSAGRCIASVFEGSPSAQVSIAEERGSSGDPCLLTCEDRSGQATCLAKTSELKVCHTRDGLYCNLDAAEPACETLPGAGARCLDYCADGLICARDRGVCEQRRLLDESCTADEECATINCERGLCTARGYCSAFVR